MGESQLPQGLTDVLTDPFENRISHGIFRDAGESPGVSHSPQATPPIHSVPRTGTAGKWYLVILGLSVAFIGGLFVGLMGRSFLRAREMHSWPEVPCVILSSELEQRRHDDNSPLEFRQNLSFGYEWKGQPLTGDHLTLRGSPWSSKRELAEDRLREYPAGMSTTCRVNPASPDFAVLKPDSLAPGYSIWFPALFVVGGLGIAIRALADRSC